ncbi:IS110 family transposase [Microbacterium protaetiae]|uniref:IS110 family transposase n=1 Tax=Microbacterium protaetiae TaxID=2509458 RepID=A0A4P6EEH3_9MICO|nr:IS110 family transposase [Microbacterium protaetiae]QAY60574.1 IS110 family transposase [Microbacterium protaetiae]
MDLLHPRAAGIDISKRDAKVAIRVQSEGGKVSTQVTTWGSMTGQVLELADFLRSQGVTTVVMEATSDYWKPFYYPMEATGLPVMLVNARQARNIPGRKSDVSDAAWLADLGAHGLLRASFVPAPDIRRLRDLTRARQMLVHDRTRVKQRLEKSLESSGTKLSVVVADLNGVSARRMLDALVAGERDPRSLAALAHPRMRATQDELAAALTGRFTEHDAFMVGQHLTHYDLLTGQIDALTARIEEEIAPFRLARELLTTIPGIAEPTADVIIAETGGDMSIFPTAAHLASWAGVSPGMHESAGKRKSSTTRPGNRYLKEALGNAASSNAKKGSNTYLARRQRRISARRGKMRALVATEHAILNAVWNMLSRGEAFTDLTPPPANTERQKKSHLRALEHLGYKVTLAPAA